MVPASPEGSWAAQGLSGAASTRFLLVTFALIFMMSITGLALSAFFGTDDEIFHDAIRIVGIGGPASAVGNSASNAIARWRAGPEAQK